MSADARMQCAGVSDEEPRCFEGNPFGCVCGQCAAHALRDGAAPCMGHPAFVSLMPTLGEALEEEGGGLGDVAGAEGEDDVAVAGDGDEAVDSLFEGWGVGGAGVAEVGDGAG